MWSEPLVFLFVHVVYLGDILSCFCSVSDREVAVEEALKLLQQFYLNLEKFLNWLTEAETTCNVLIDATNKERMQEQPDAARNLLAQWKVEDCQILLFLPCAHRTTPY